MSIHTHLLTEGDQEKNFWSPQRSGQTMLVKLRSYWKANPVVGALIITMILILSCIVTTGFIWVMTDQVIAPPGLRVLDWLWRAFLN